MENKKITKKPKVSVIILSYNTKELLKNCLESLIKEGRKEKLIEEIILVDNGSQDGSIEVMENFKLKIANLPNFRVKIIKNKKNLGFGAGNNQGMRKAEGEYFLLLNSDTIIKNLAPLKMAEFMDKNPNIGVLGCRLLNPDGSWQPSCGYFPHLWVSFLMLFGEHWFGNLVRFSPKKTKEVDWVMGAAMMVRPEVLKDAGFMDEEIFMYMDEVEWCWRIKKAGWKIIFWPGAEIIHLGGGSSPSGRKWPIINIYRGLCYFYQKHKSQWQKNILKFMLKSKAWLAVILGKITKNKYLIETYEEALAVIGK
ncbi:MAG: glycosyltransferase family 2 protein [Microgenomates group bacterium]